MKLYLMRHEKRDINNPKFDSPLLNEGINNAEKLKFTLDKLNPTLIYVSPFKRVLQTIKPFCDLKNVKVNREFGLYEHIETNKGFDTNNFRSDVERTDLEYSILNTKYNSVIPLSDINVDDDCSKRVDIFIKEILTKYRDTNENILIVTHMTIVNTILKRDVELFFPMGGLCEVTDFNNFTFVYL